MRQVFDDRGTLVQRLVIDEAAQILDGACLIVRVAGAVFRLLPCQTYEVVDFVVGVEDAELAFRAEERVRILFLAVFAVGDGECHHIESLFNDPHGVAVCRLDAGAVAVVQQAEVVGVTSDGSNLFVGECGAAGGNHIGHSELVEFHHVGVALHQHAHIVLPDGGYGEVEAEQFLPFIVDDGFAAVQVFRIRAVERAPGKGDDAPGAVEDGEHQPVAEKVVQTAVPVAPEQVAGGQLCIRPSFSFQMEVQRLPSIVGVTDFPARNRLFIETALCILLCGAGKL